MTTPVADLNVRECRLRFIAEQQGLALTKAGSGQATWGREGDAYYLVDQNSKAAVTGRRCSLDDIEYYLAAGY